MKGRCDAKLDKLVHNRICERASDHKRKLLEKQCERLCRRGFMGKHIRVEMSYRPAATMFALTNMSMAKSGSMRLDGATGAAYAAATVVLHLLPHRAVQVFELELSHGDDTL